MKLMINEIYHSIQGESSYSGRPCIFIRLTYCNLRCSYCDPCNLVEVTGGEPLFQKNCIILLQKLVENKYEVLLETSGSLSIESVPKQVINIIDFKCPSSKMVKKNLWENINYLKKDDEIKFVIADKEDYVWAKNKISEYELTKKSNILMSPAYNEIESKKIVDWILRDNLNVRFQIQLHKEIWDPDKKGV